MEPEVSEPSPAVLEGSTAPVVDEPQTSAEAVIPTPAVVESQESVPETTLQETIALVEESLPETLAEESSLPEAEPLVKETTSTAPAEPVAVEPSAESETPVEPSKERILVEEELEPKADAGDVPIEPSEPSPETLKEVSKPATPEPVVPADDSIAPAVEIEESKGTSTVTPTPIVPAADVSILIQEPEPIDPASKSIEQIDTTLQGSETGDKVDHPDAVQGNGSDPEITDDGVDKPPQKSVSAGMCSL